MKRAKASGTALWRCRRRGYSTPGGGLSRSAHVTFSGNQNLSLQSQSEIEEVIGEPGGGNQEKKEGKQPVVNGSKWRTPRAGWGGKKHYLSDIR